MDHDPGNVEAVAPAGTPGTGPNKKVGLAKLQDTLKGSRTLPLVLLGLAIILVLSGELMGPYATVKICLFSKKY